MLDSLVRVSRRVLRVPETESSQTETRTVRDNTAATTGTRARFIIYTVRQPVGHRHGPATPRKGRLGAPERRLDRHRTGRDALLREKCTPSVDVNAQRTVRHDRNHITSNTHTHAAE
ncbi:hypothetical protein ABMA27_011223 [Loxostege sticticalis]|uniref:Uncharacterized protein n=1 Tax=Loxostege sticticalis TaxID=481309 RepID=A0ABR3H2H5_LOXSC